MSEPPIRREPSLHHPGAPDERRLETGAATFRVLSDPTQALLSTQTDFTANVSQALMLTP